MNKKLIKRLIIAGFFIFIVYLTLPKVYNTKSSKTLKLEQYEIYNPSDIFGSDLTDKSKLYISNKFGLKEINLDEPIRIEENTQAKIIKKISPFKTETTTYDIKVEDTIPPKIITQKNVILKGGENLKNVLDIKVYDYRFGEYNFELKPPYVDFVTLIPGDYEYEIEVEDLSGNKATHTISIKSETVEIPLEEANSLEVWTNRVRKLPKDFEPNLSEIPLEYNLSNDNIPFRLQPEAKTAFMDMADTLKEEKGLTILITSAYRSYEYQEMLFNNYVAQDGLEKAQTYSAKPGHSEHQTGLTVDIRTPQFDIKDFEDTDESNWIKDNSYKFGFIVRYPKDKENITGYQYEPWHLRYVGQDLAKYLYDNQLTFDEYILQNTQ